MKKIDVARGLLLLFIFWTIGCTEVARRDLSICSESGTVQLYNGGVLVRQWEIKHGIDIDAVSGTWKFVDKSTNRFICIRDGLVFEQEE